MQLPVTCHRASSRRKRWLCPEPVGSSRCGERPPLRGSLESTAWGCHSLPPEGLFDLPSAIMLVSWHCKRLPPSEHLCLDVPSPLLRVPDSTELRYFRPWSPPYIQRPPLPCFSSLIGILCPSQVIARWPWVWSKVGSSKGNEGRQCNSHGKEFREGLQALHWVAWECSRSCEVNFSKFIPLLLLPCVRWGRLHIKALMTHALNEWRNEWMILFPGDRLRGQWKKQMLDDIRSAGPGVRRCGFHEWVFG